MKRTEIIKNAWQRMYDVVKSRPAIGEKTVTTKIRLLEDTTCEIVHKDWKVKVDIGTAEGGNNAGPGPGLLQRGALGSCLIIGYIQHAAVLGVPIKNIEVDVEADQDISGRLGLNNSPSGTKGLRYKVSVESPADEEEILKVIERADEFSPLLDDFRRAVPVNREIEIAHNRETIT